MSRLARIKTVSRAGACALALVLAGCGSQSGGVTGGMADWTQVLDLMQTQLGPSPAITLDQAAAVPYATLGIRIGDGQQAMVVLAADSGGDLLWTSKAKIAVTTRAGRIVRTAGLPRNIDAVSFPSGDPVLDVARGAAQRQSIRYSDFWDLNRYSVPLHCLTASRGADQVVILGKSIAVTRVEETCESATMDWSFTDTFWVGASGLVWKSIQHYHPNYDPLELEILRPPA